MVLAIAVATPNAALGLAISPPFPLARRAAESMPDEASIIASITAIANSTDSLLYIALPPWIWWEAPSLPSTCPRAAEPHSPNGIDGVCLFGLRPEVLCVYGHLLLYAGL